MPRRSKHPRSDDQVKMKRSLRGRPARDLLAHHRRRLADDPFATLSATVRRLVRIGIAADRPADPPPD